MVEHRRTPGNKVSVPAGWFIVLSVLACVGAAGWLGVLLVEPTSASAEDTSASATPTPTASSEPAPTTSSPSPSPEATTPEPSASATPEEVEREATVSVLNNTGITNLAKGFAGRVAGAGWTVAATGNWRGQIAANTVYYPDGLRPQADLLADDVGIERVMPSIVPMRMDRLTIILSGPQQ